MKAIRAKPQRLLWDATDIRLLRRQYARGDLRALAMRCSHTLHQLYAQANALGLHRAPDLVAATNRELGKRLVVAGVAHRFRKGQVPPNKGLRRPGWSPGRMAETQFKKGARPHTWKPIGSLRINADGLLDRKVSDTGYPPRDWVGVHRLIWSAAHGPIPRGHKVAFLPGRKSIEAEKITLDAVELVSDAELMRRNSYHNRYPKEIGLAIQARGALVRQINKRLPEKLNGRIERRRQHRRATADHRAAQRAVRNHQRSAQPGKADGRRARQNHRARGADDHQLGKG